jgi:O-acetylhomoserine/O-acetylserine sulfhydrylase-like pyridoxal-dependent enzyme
MPLVLLRDAFDWLTSCLQVSVGIEAIGDIIADFSHAFDQAIPEQ